MKIEVGKHYRTRGGQKVFQGNQPDVTVRPWSGDDGFWRCDNGRLYSDGKDRLHDFIAEWSDDKTPKLWRDMTPEEKGALLLADQEGQVTQYYCGDGWKDAGDPVWHGHGAYRIKPKPKVDVVTYLMHCDGTIPFIARDMSDPTHRITMTIRDGKPDCKSIKMEELT